ncbi:MAG: hypothetical protein JZD41_02845 [Thermoproteus sp.]|nr:hypothetical protein [Thermoproteus sp.]
MEVELEGDRASDRAVILDRLEYVLIGVTMLESLDLKVDPGTGKLE